MPVLTVVLFFIGGFVVIYTGIGGLLFIFGYNYSQSHTTFFFYLTVLTKRHPNAAKMAASIPPQLL